MPGPNLNRPAELDLDPTRSPVDGEGASHQLRGACHGPSRVAVPRACAAPRRGRRRSEIVGSHGAASRRASWARRRMKRRASAGTETSAAKRSTTANTASWGNLGKLADAAASQRASRSTTTIRARCRRRADRGRPARRARRPPAPATPRPTGAAAGRRPLGAAACGGTLRGRRPSSSRSVRGPVRSAPPPAPRRTRCEHDRPLRGRLSGQRRSAPAAEETASAREVPGSSRETGRSDSVGTRRRVKSEGTWRNASGRCRAPWRSGASSCSGARRIRRCGRASQTPTSRGLRASRGPRAPDPARRTSAPGQPPLLLGRSRPPRVSAGRGGLDARLEVRPIGDRALEGAGPGPER